MPPGFYDPFPDETEWYDLCNHTITDILETSCVYSVRTNREYKLRVRETCSDQLAFSQWTENTGTCRTEPKRAEGPIFFKVGGIRTGDTLANFQATWTPHWNTD